jgi:hypothetical protein
MGIECAVKRAGELAGEIERNVEAGRFFVYQDSCRALWDLYEGAEGAGTAEQIAEHIGFVRLLLGNKSVEEMDFIRMSGYVNDIRGLAERFPGSRKLTRDFLGILRGLFGLKLRFQEFDYVDEYLPEVLALGGRFSDDEEVQTAAAFCIANLLRLCPHANIEIRIVAQAQNRLGEIAERFPKNGEINLALRMQI